jgi:hypothetical protein
MAYDPVARSILVHGGDGVEEETWVLDRGAGTWSRGFDSTLFGGRSGHALLHGDLGLGARTYAVGGFAADDLTALDYDGALWSASVPGLPAGRDRAPLAYDAARGRLLLHGSGTDEAPRASDTWAASAGGFEPLDLPAPTLAATAMAYDAGRARTVLFGCAPGLPPECGTWEDGGAGFLPVATAHAPPARALHAVAFDAARGRVVLFGGRSPAGIALGDTWAYDGADWTQLAGPGPTARHSAALAYDAARDRVILHGGRAGLDPLDDTWALGPAGWTEVTPDLRPPASYGAGLAYDPVRGAVTLYDGDGATWDLAGGDWTGPVPAAPGRRAQAALAFDPARRGLALFGGASAIGSLGDLWLLDRHRPGAVYAAHQAVFTVDPGATLVAATLAYAGAARGDVDGAASPGVEVLAWDWDAGAWVALATTDASDPAAGAIQIPFPASPARFCRHGRIVLLAAPTAPSSGPGGAVQSEIWTDLVELRVTYEPP